jgi:DNA invertase Pin-like site-specific DNA recombinase
MKLGYARVSTDEQETHLQLDALKAAGCYGWRRGMAVTVRLSGLRADRRG